MPDDRDRTRTHPAPIGPGFVADPPQSPGRVDAAEAVTGRRAREGGAAPPGEVVGDDAPLEAETPPVAPGRTADPEALDGDASIDPLLDR
jgi:hypothetical protein